MVIGSEYPQELLLDAQDKEEEANSDEIRERLPYIYINIGM